MRTVKNKNDKRFLTTEQKINRTFISSLSRGNVSFCVKQLCAKAKIFHSTFYSHYSGINRVLLRIEKQMYDTFLGSISSDVTVKTFIQKLLIFISKNHGYFLMADKHSDHHWLSNVLTKMRPLLTNIWRPRRQEVLDYWFQLLCSEIIATLMLWGKQSKFDIKDASVVQRRLEKLINTAEARFRHLGNLK